MFTEETRQAIDTVGQQIAPDVCIQDLQDPEVMAELVLDADRLTTFGFPEAAAEVKSLIAMRGWQAVRQAAAKITSYA